MDVYVATANEVYAETRVDLDARHTTILGVFSTEKKAQEAIQYYKRERVRVDESYIDTEPDETQEAIQYYKFEDYYDIEFSVHNLTVDVVVPQYLGG